MKRDTENNEIIILKNEMEYLISTRNIYYSVPATLNDGVYRVKDLNDMIRIAKKNTKNNWYERSVIEFYTYWDLKKDKPLFDVILEKEGFSYDIKYTLSNCSLFGMFWMIDGNSLSVGAKNVIHSLKLDVPLVMDMRKYTENEFKKAMIGMDFSKKTTPPKKKTK